MHVRCCSKSKFEVLLEKARLYEGVLVVKISKCIMQREEK